MLDVKHVSRRYGAVTAVSQVSFTVRPGEVLGYLGPNGSGKSTTVKMLAGLMPHAEAFEIAGRDHMQAVGDRSFKAKVLDFFAEHPIA